MNHPYDLISLVLTLRLSPGYREDQPPPTWWGRAAHALLLDVLRSYDPELANSLHGSPGKADNGEGQPSLRPFTASTLIGRFPDGQLSPDQVYTLRLTGLTRAVSSILYQARLDGPLSPGLQVELDRLPFMVENAAPGPNSKTGDPPAEPMAASWSSTTTYQELGAPYLLAGRAAPRRIRLQFASPTTFKSGGMHVPVPMPELVFGSLLERWNAFAPVAFPSEVRRYAAECLAIARYRLSSRAVAAKGGGLRVGGVGEITYLTLNYDRYWMSVIATLAAFALYAGVGVGASMGLGQCRAMEV